MTGGAGFIGTNLVDRLLGRGDAVVVYDDLSRDGVSANADWLRSRHGGPTLVVGRVEERDVLAPLVAEADVVVHLAGQTAVTRSIVDPVADFHANALGALNVLEAARSAPTPPIVLYASTNKVYGPLGSVPVVEGATRYEYADAGFAVGEDRPLDFHSPYGCSKGAGDQYALDYARVYGLRTVVFRQSCIYGPRQLGVEDQGWMAWFVIAALTGRTIRICGDGKQVRDVLHVDDLLDAYDAAIERIDHVAGRVFNIGGGTGNSLSVWEEFGPLLERVTGHRPETVREPWRAGDQRVYLSDTTRAAKELGWRPRIAVERGVEDLVDWVGAEIDLFRDGPA